MAIPVFNPRSIAHRGSPACRIPRRGRVACSLRLGCQRSALGVWKATRRLRRSVFPAGPDRGASKIRSVPYSPNPSWRCPDRRWRCDYFSGQRSLTPTANFKVPGTKGRDVSAALTCSVDSPKTRGLAAGFTLRGRGFLTLFRHSRLGLGHRLAHRQNFCRGGGSPFDPSDHRFFRSAHGGHGYKPAFPPQTIHQSTLPRAQHLLRQRGKVSERPHQIRALRETWLYISRPDRRIYFQNAIGEFFNPHGLAHPGVKRSTSPLSCKAGHYCTSSGALGSNLFTRTGRLSEGVDRSHGPGCAPDQV